MTRIIDVWQGATLPKVVNYPFPPRAFQKVV